MSAPKNSGFSTVEGVLILVAVGAVGFSSWYVYHSKNVADKSYNNAALASLQTQQKKTNQSTQQHNLVPQQTGGSPISASLRENTAAAMESKNTAALQGYMAGSVNVVVAGSGHDVMDTPVQAVMELDYFKDAVSPWNFSLDSATLTSYKNGSYGQYFSTDTIVGKSSDNMVVSFSVSSNGKIDKIFMASQASMLTEYTP